MLVSISEMFPVPVAAASEIPATKARDQVITTDPLEATVLEVGIYVKLEELQTAVGVSVLDNAGVGFTTTTTLLVAEHPFAVIV